MKAQSKKRRVVDYVAYVAIGLALVAACALAAALIPDVSLASQIGISFFTFVILMVVIAPDFWRSHQRRLLVEFGVVALAAHLGLYVLWFKFLGPVRPQIATAVTLVEAAILWWLADWALQRKQRS